MTVIRFNENGRPYWAKMTTKQYETLHYKIECNYTQQDKEWFRKSLAKMD